MRVRISQDAFDDIREASRFYDQLSPGLGKYFRKRISEDIECLSRNGPINPVIHGDIHRLLCNVFPFSIFYRSRSSWLEVIAILDLRRNPAWIREKLSRIR
ncbi:MAG: hypothetical protein BGO12_10310 [Verrucomicrobia bacterium 61-8]|nr:MAG: hypothetical protein BGO12_10310 [Verrucomicrobia bacterium 61-8]